MSAIGDELRAWVKDADLLFTQIVELNEIANLIDERMVEWPLGADKKPVRPGQTVYLSPLGNTRDGFVRGISFDTDGPTVCVEREGALMAMMPEWLTHERPDSLERIADELDEWRFEHMHDLEADDSNDMSLFSDRIRRLAERENKHERE